MPLSVNIIGAGSLGKTLARLLVLHRAATLRGICNRSLQSAQQAVAFIGAGMAVAQVHDLPPADITFITTPDSAIGVVSTQLARSPGLRPQSVVLHCSGCETSELLAAVKARGCHVASVHPMRSFAHPEQSVADYAGTFCAMEGDAQAEDLLEVLFRAIGSNVYRIAREGKAFYHTAGVFASNYVVTLTERAKACLNAAGVEDALAMQILVNILRGTVSNLDATRAPACALTGPIRRGDHLTLEKHLHTLDGTHDARLYAELGLATIALTEHAQDVRAHMEKLLRDGLASPHDYE